ncbi:MAG TPA: B12-binding domain-containing radical SAM protein, partial [Gammaproteobacteria bacterium]|nr:B12-binding domain-containing radical SAM protein [Gammaproteobacteria bacterium]
MDMLTNVRHRRRILCVFPRYAHSFGTFEHAFSMLSVRAFLPPQGILLITSYLPDEWDVRFVDENIALAKDRDFQWADVVFVTGMHVQSASIHRIIERAHQFGKLTAAGGPSVSGCPDWYPDVDLLHIGEIGDATDHLIMRIDADISRPDKQERYTTVER